MRKEQTEQESNFMFCSFQAYQHSGSNYSGNETEDYGQHPFVLETVSDHTPIIVAKYTCFPTFLSEYQPKNNVLVISTSPEGDDRMSACCELSYSIRGRV